MKTYETRSRPGWEYYFLDQHLLASLIAALGVAIAVVLGIFGGQLTTTGDFQCAPDETLILPDQTLRLSWNARYFFSITLAWGEFDLNTAKIIDVAWDLILGRGGQVLLSLLAFSILRQSMCVSLEKRPWHLPALTHLTLDPVSFTGLWTAMKDMRRGAPARLFGFTYVIAYILAFGTIMSAMTGYRSRMEPLYPQGEGSVPLQVNKLTQVYPLELVNATREGPRGNACLTIEPSDNCISNAFPDCVVPPGGECYDAWQDYGNLYTGCTVMEGHGEWAENTVNTPSGERNGTGSCKTNDTLSPAFIDWASYSTGNFYFTRSNLSIDGQVYRLGATPVYVQKWDQYHEHSDDGKIPRFWRDDTGVLITSTWLRDNVLCQTEKDYQWGFSAVMLFTFSILTSIFGVILMLLNGTLRRPTSKSRAPGYFSVYRDILDLSQEIRKELGDGVDDLPAGRIDKRINTSTGEVRIEEQVLLASCFEPDGKAPLILSDAAQQPSWMHRLYFVGWDKFIAASGRVAR